MTSDFSFDVASEVNLQEVDNAVNQAKKEREKIKVSSAKKDDLQAVIAHLRAADFPLALQFCNYR